MMPLQRSLWSRDALVEAITAALATISATDAQGWFAHVGDRVAVMYVGKIIELAPTDMLFATPQHPYTEVLMSAVPVPDPRLRNRRMRIKPKGEVADPVNPPSGCYFHPRCQYAQERCASEEPALREVKPGHFAACHFAESLDLLRVRQMTESSPNAAG